MDIKLLKKLKAGQAALGLQLNFPNPGIIECIGAGWDWIWIDAQHGLHDYRSILECVRLADACGFSPVVRVAGHEPSPIGRIMDMNPVGLMVPMVNDAKEAKEIVNAMRFPPLGERSFGGRRVIDMNGRHYYKTADENTILIAQIETIKAVENAEAIASVEGVDVLFFSPDDMRLRLGIDINTSITDSDQLGEAMQKVIVAAKKYGKAGGCVTPTPEAAKMASELGYSCLVATGDVAILREGSSAKQAAFRKTLD